jgi:4'-phosphopantetheinyl transferase
VAIVEVHLGTLDVGEAEVARLARLIDAGEQARAARFRFERDRRRFIARRGVLREILGEETGTAPERLTFTANGFGKPMLADDGPCFSLSHSGDRMMVAIAPIEIGCDIERIDEEMDWRPIADRLVAPGERLALAALPEAAGRKGFFECWARKEAFVKAVGQGLSYPLDAFEVSVDRDARLLAAGAGWSIAVAPSYPGYAGAVVARDDGTSLEIRQSL